MVFFVVFCLRNRKSKQASRQANKEEQTFTTKSVSGLLKILPVSLSFYFLAIEQTTSLRRTSNPFTQKDRAEKVEVRRCNRTEQRKAEKVKRKPQPSQQ